MNYIEQKTILIVENDPLATVIEKRILEKNDFKVICVQTGEEAVNQVAINEDINLVLMDINLGEGIDGTEASIIILQKRDIPIIFISSHTEREIVEKTEGITSYGYVVKNTGDIVLLVSIKMAFRLFEAKMQEKKKEEELRESELRVRAKMAAILLPEGDIGELELEDLIDISAFQSLMDSFYEIAKIGIGVIDLKGKVLVSKGWQDICTKFHRVHLSSAQNCFYSDTQLTLNCEHGSYKAYRCKNNLWDLSIPIIVGGKHLGNIIVGQFFYQNEIIDYQLFREQAKKYGFDEEEYLESLDKVPRVSQDTVEKVIIFYSKLAGIISNISYSNLKLARTLEEHKRSEQSLHQEQWRLQRIIESSNLGTWECNVQTGESKLSDRWAEIIGYTLDEISPVSIETWRKYAHPDDLVESDKIIQKHFNGETDYYECEYRMKHKDGSYVWVLGRGKVSSYDHTGKPIMMFGTHQDITERKLVEIEREILLRSTK